MIALAWLGCVQHVPRPAPLPEPLPPRPIEHPAEGTARLANGLELRVYTDPATEVFDVSFAGHGAGATSPEGRACAHVLAIRGRVRRTDALDPAAFDAAARATGALVYPVLESRAVGVGITATTSRADQVFPLFAGLVTATVRDRDHDRVLRAQLSAEVLHEFATISSVADTLAWGRAYAGTLAGRGCSPASVGAIDDAAVDAVLGRVFAPAHAAVVVYGPWTVDEVARRLEPLLGSWSPASEDPLPDSVRPPTSPAVWVADVPGVNQTSFSALIPAGPHAEATRPGLELVAAALTVRLHERLREKEGWSYGAYCAVRRPETEQAWLWCMTDVQADATGPAWTALHEELASPATRPLTDEEVGRAIATVHDLLWVRTLDQLVTTERRGWAHGFAAGWRAREDEAVLATTPDALRTLAASLASQAPVVGVAGDLAVVVPALEGVGVELERRAPDGSPWTPSAPE